MQTPLIAAVVLALTVIINVGLAYAGISQKLTCTVEQSAAAAAAVLSLPDAE